jgi:hypothetical protein
VKFQLAPYNRDLSDDVILDDLRDVARKLGKEYVTKDDYNEHGRLSASALQKRFGSWCRAHELAGLRKIRHYDATAEDCVRDLQLVAAKLGKTTLAFKDYQPHGRYSIALFGRRCGSFKAADEIPCDAEGLLQVPAVWGEPGIKARHCFGCRSRRQSACEPGPGRIGIQPFPLAR